MYFPEVKTMARILFKINCKQKLLGLSKDILGW
jgi:hypothetical protein